MYKATFESTPDGGKTWEPHYAVFDSQTTAEQFISDLHLYNNLSLNPTFRNMEIVEEPVESEPVNEEVELVLVSEVENAGL